MKPIPTLSYNDGRPTLMIDGNPTLLFAGELHNSSASSLDYMEKEVWPHLRDLHLNAVIAPVSWEFLEPRPGEFDFTLVDGLLSQAHREGVRLVLLWFGLWKNGASTYIPAWMKQDRDTYVLMRTRDGRAVDAIPLVPGRRRAGRSGIPGLAGAPSGYRHGSHCGDGPGGKRNGPAGRLPGFRS